MTVSFDIKRWVLLGLLFVLTSCSGTGMDSGGSGGTGSPVVSSGSVTGFGSIIVNGTEYDTSDASITLNGQPGSEADLRLGQVVTVRGTLAPGGTVGSAETIRVASNVAGPIDSIDPEDDRLVVLGQPVLINEATQFGDIPFDDLRVGNIVVVSGFADADGALRATRVEKTQDAFTADIAIEATGTIANLDVDNQTFNLNGLRVNYAMAQLMNVPDNQLAEGQLVQAISSQNVMNGVLLAASVEGQTIGLQGNPGDIAELQGIITRVTSPTTFEVNGQAVRFTSDTVFEKGSAADIASNVPVEIEGIFNDDGSILAEEVEFSAGAEIRGAVSAVLSATRFEVDGQPVQITPDTTIHAQAVDDIQLGRQVEVSGFFNMDDILVATEIDFFLLGTITAVTSATTFEVEGQALRFTPDTVFEGGTADDIAADVPVDVEGFFDADDVFVAIEIDLSP